MSTFLIQLPLPIRFRLVGLRLRPLFKHKSISEPLNFEFDPNIDKTINFIKMLKFV